MTKKKCSDFKCVDSSMEIIKKGFFTFNINEDFEPNEKDLKIDLLGCLNCGKLRLFSSPCNIKEYMEIKKTMTKEKCSDSSVQIIEKGLFSIRNKKNTNEGVLVDVSGCINSGEIFLSSSPCNIKEYIEKIKNDD